jgi:hypothetical protein
MVYADDIGCNKNHGVNDEGRSFFGDLLSLAAIAAAAYNSVKAVQIAEDEWEMAKKYWQISKNWLDYYKDNYAPVEDQELEEAMNIPVEEPDYEVARGRARVSAWLEFRGITDKAIRCTSRYCTGLRADILTDLSIAQAAAVAIADGLGYRNERAYIESRNEVRFEKMMNTAKRGRDMLADNVSLAKSAAGIYGDLWNQAWSGIQGAGSYLGYYFNRNDTQYPTTYTADRATMHTQATGGLEPIQGYAARRRAQVEQAGTQLMKENSFAFG